MTAQVAATNLIDLERLERAIDRAYEPIADSLGLRDRKAVEQRITYLRDGIKAALISDRELGRYEPLHDGELNVTAELQDRAGGDLIDLIALAEQQPDVLITAAKAGLLRCDAAAARKSYDNGGSGWLETLLRFAMPGRGTTALIVTRGNRR